MLLFILHSVVFTTLFAALVEEANDSGLAADTVCESDIGDSDLDAAVDEPVSEVSGEYFLCKTECLVSIVLTKFALEEVDAGRLVPITFAVLITTGTGLAETDVPLTSC